MLQSIHDKLKGWLAGVVLGAIGLVFVFWGINWTMSAPNYAAKVNGSEVSANEVRQSYQQQLAQVERQANVSGSSANSPGLRFPRTSMRTRRLPTTPRSRLITMRTNPRT